MKSVVLSLQASTSRAYIWLTISGKTNVASAQTFTGVVALPHVDVDREVGAVAHEIGVVHTRCFTTSSPI